MNNMFCVICVCEELNAVMYFEGPITKKKKKKKK